VVHNQIELSLDLRAVNMRIALLAFAITLFSAVSISAGQSDQNFGCAIVAEVTSIYDGDTFRCNIAGYPAIIGERVPVRINGIDTPELKDNRKPIKQLARLAKQHTVQRLREGRKIELRNMKRGKYFRIVADVFVDGRNLGQELVQKGLAKPYDGGKKPKWP
jgi:endonuclease YncB( thermonuclease family)